jgi:hypothetical protein
LTGERDLFLQLKDADQGSVIGGLTPACPVNDIAVFLVEEGPERPAGKNEVEARVDLLVFPVMGPYMASGVRVVEWLKIAS